MRIHVRDISELDRFEQLCKLERRVLHTQNHRNTPWQNAPSYSKGTLLHTLKFFYTACKPNPIQQGNSTVSDVRFRHLFYAWCPNWEWELYYVVDISYTPPHYIMWDILKFYVIHTYRLWANIRVVSDVRRQIDIL